MPTLVPLSKIWLQPTAVEDDHLVTKFAPEEQLPATVPPVAGAQIRTPAPLLVKIPGALAVGQVYGTFLILMRSPEGFTWKGLPLPTLSRVAGAVVPMPTRIFWKRAGLGVTDMGLLKPMTSGCELSTSIRIKALDESMPTE